MKSAISQTRQHRQLMQVVFDSGYFDQAHFIKEFKLFTELPPTDYFRARTLVDKSFSGFDPITNTANISGNPHIF
jgi:AraC-like DNA-binding protein